MSAHRVRGFLSGPSNDHPGQPRSLLGGTELPPGAGALPSATASLGTEEALGLNPVTPQVTHEDGV